MYQINLVLTDEQYGHLEAMACLLRFLRHFSGETYAETAAKCVQTVDIILEDASRPRPIEGKP